MTSDLHFPLQRRLTASDRERAQLSVRPLSRALRRVQATAGGNALTVVWIGDLHLHARRRYPWPLEHYASHVDSSANLRLALAEIAALDPLPDLLVLGGDLADSGCPSEAPADEYGELKRVLDAALPRGLKTLPLLGNHDHGDVPLTPKWHRAFRRVRRAEWPVPADRHHYYHETRLGGWRFLALDSRQNQPLDERQFQWLRQRLTQDAAVPTVLMMHRPFVSVGNWVDQYRLLDRRAFDLVDGTPGVKAVLSGHTHKTAAWTYRGKLHYVFPSCAYGIPDPCGWGVVVIGKRDVRAAFVKDVCGETYDSVTLRPRRSRGAFRQLAPQVYERSPLLDPCSVPRWREG